MILSLRRLSKTCMRPSSPLCWFFAILHHFISVALSIGTDPVGLTSYAWVGLTEARDAWVRLWVRPAVSLVTSILVILFIIVIVVNLVLTKKTHWRLTLKTYQKPKDIEMLIRVKKITYNCTSFTFIGSSSSSPLVLLLFRRSSLPSDLICMSLSP